MVVIWYYDRNTSLTLNAQGDEAMTTFQRPTEETCKATWRTRRRRPSTPAAWSSPTVSSARARGVPVVFLTHLAAVLDNWDPRVVDGIAAKHRVIAFDNRGVGASSGSTPTTIEEMARDAVTFIRALGFDQVDLFGFSMGGMIAQVIAQQAAAARAQDDPRRNRPCGRRRHRQGDPHHLPRHRARTAHPPGPQAVPLLHQDAERAPSRQGVPGTAGGTYERPRQGHLRSAHSAPSSRPSTDGVSRSPRTSRASTSRCSS